MRVCRFMSEEEYQKYRTGQVLRNTTDQRYEWHGSSAKGFCFFEVGKAHDTPEERMRYLKGIASMDRCVIMDTTAYMHKSSAKYRNPWMAYGRCLLDNVPTMTRSEYSTTEYSRENFRLVRVGIPDVMLDTITWIGGDMEETR